MQNHNAKWLGKRMCKNWEKPCTHLRVVCSIELVCAVCLEMQKLSMECISVLKWPENTYHDAIGRSVCVIEFGMV